jgi:hypothetical protein
MRPIVTAILTLALAAAAAGGVVMTLDARLEGDVTFAEGAVTVGGKTVPWAQVIDVVHEPAVRTIPPPGAVYTVGGEIWRGEVLRLAGGRLAARFPLFGEREVSQKSVTAIEFAPGAPSLGPIVHENLMTAPGTLYREGAEPLPGTLLWIDHDRLAVDSPLGAVTLDRDGCLAFAFNREGLNLLNQAGRDTVGLVDGTVLVGKVSVGDGVVRLEHATFGEVEIDAALVRHVARHDPRVRRLPGCDLLRAPSTCEMTLPTGRGRAATFVARLRPLPGAHGDARVCIAVGETVLLERAFGPRDDAVTLRRDVPAGGDLRITVDRGERLGFPCGVRIEDAMCITAEADGK